MILQKARRGFDRGVLLRRRNAEPATPRVPAGTRIYAVGDIHGRADLLDMMTQSIDADLAARPVQRAIEVYLGDYVDRGPDSYGVVTRLLARSFSQEVVCLKGNHELLFQRFLQDPGTLATWAANGGLATLASYGLSPLLETNPEIAEVAAWIDMTLPRTHREWLAGLPPLFHCGDYVFVHAGIRPGVALSEQTELDLLWIRSEFLGSTADHGKVVVHGHTPTSSPEVLSNRIGIDTGAYMSGRLTCLVLEDDRQAIMQVAGAGQTR
jgi:serine/threonine protein phosphatase 1